MNVMVLARSKSRICRGGKRENIMCHNFALERIQFSCSISAGLTVHVVESRGMLQKRGTRNKHGGRENNNKKREQKRELEI